MKIEFKRQVLHILLGVFYLLLFLLLEQQVAITALILVFALGSLFSFTHAHVKAFPFLRYVLGTVQRNGETRIPGRAALSFTLGVLLSSIVFSQLDRLVTIGAITAVTFGDGFSTLIGKGAGKFKTFGGKTLEGTIAGIVAAWVSLMLFFPLETALATAIFAMLAEYLPVNDNYTIPLTAGIVLAFLI